MCETEVLDACEYMENGTSLSSPQCQNEGTCVNGSRSDSPGSFVCVCAQGFTGPFCQYSTLTLSTGLISLYIVQLYTRHSLPPALCENMSLTTFKTKLKTYLLRRSQWLSKTTRRCCGVLPSRRHHISDFTYLLNFFETRAGSWVVKIGLLHFSTKPMFCSYFLS